uniref:Uncharacterized protein n=1 Tax=Ditylenchus dipsaci TaxID=166011 RepID=A0A915DA43_9BILA
MVGQVGQHYGGRTQSSQNQLSGKGSRCATGKISPMNATPPSQLPPRGGAVSRGVVPAQTQRPPPPPYTGGSPTPACKLASNTCSPVLNGSRQAPPPYPGRSNTPVKSVPVIFVPRDTSTPKSNGLSPSLPQNVAAEGETRLCPIDMGERKEKAMSVYENVNHQQQARQATTSPPNGVIEVPIEQIRKPSESGDIPPPDAAAANGPVKNTTWYEYGCV